MLSGGREKKNSGIRYVNVRMKCETFQGRQSILRNKQNLTATIQYKVGLLCNAQITVQIQQ